ncbi:MAG TPA: glycosyltransferase family 87 protein [Bryobacteraceae bacterium]|nr:glycosyltransferase family 87 protein [Bryobacteraceae bacterium]
MSNERRDGLYLVLVGSLVFILLGAVFEGGAPAPLADFKTIYFASRTLIQQRDPFNQSEVTRIYQAERESRAPDAAKDRQIATQNIYPPNTLFLVMPFAALPSKLAGILWLIVTFASFITASFLVWNLSADYAPALSGALIGFLLATSELLAVTGNVAGIAIGLSAISVWCFVRGRLVILGIVCLAVSLVLKPHDTGLVWLYFLLAGSTQRKRALKALSVALVLSLPGFVWVWRVAPQWLHEWKVNLAAYSVHGGVNDPGLLSSGGHGLDSLISLQTIFSVFRDDPRFYNTAADLVCGPLLLVWIYLVLRRRSSPCAPWMALAAVAALTMLPIYHRQLDASLLLLAVPGCALLWSQSRIAGRIGLAITATVLMFTGISGWIVVQGLLSVVHPSPTNWGRWLAIALQVFPTPFILLATVCFYLWAFAQQSCGPATASQSRLRD